VRELVAGVSDSLRQVPSLLLLAWATVAVALVAVPVVLTLVRDSRFDASVEITPADPDIAPSTLAASVRRLVEDTGYAEATIRDSVVVVDDGNLAERVSAIPLADTVRVTVWGRTPEEASRLLDALLRQAADAAEQDDRLLIVLGPARTSAPSRAVDRAIDRLPGPLPRRPSPIGVAFAGLLVALLGCAVIAFLWSRHPAAAAANPTDA